MKQLALEAVARTLDSAQIGLLTDEFDRADKNNNGEVRGFPFLCSGVTAVRFADVKVSSYVLPRHPFDDGDVSKVVRSLLLLACRSTHDDHPLACRKI